MKANLIQYTTDGKALLECANAHVPNVTVSWYLGEKSVAIIANGQSVRLSKAQLLQLCEIAPQICYDLEPLDAAHT